MIESALKISLLKEILLQTNHNHKNMISNNLNNLCLHNPEIPLININHIKNAQTVIKQITLFQHVSKNSEMMMTKETHMQDLNILENVLYNTFVLILVITITHTE